jgi:ABC-type Fe3+ transport system substrate-binding protein
LDNRILIGIAVIVIVAGISGYMLMKKPETPGPENGENGSPPPPPVTNYTIISGTVTDTDTGDPIGVATVTLDGETVTTTSDGTYELNTTTGSYTIMVSKEGYEDETTQVAATEEETYTVDFSLTPIPPVQPTTITLKVITRHGSDITQTAEQLFLESEYAKKYNIEEIRWMAVGSTLWVDTIERMGDIDVGWGGGPVLFDVVNNEGLLAPLTSNEVNDVMPEIPDEIGGVPSKRIKDGEVYWVGAAISSFGFTINTQYLEDLGLPEPSKWTDLANETYAVTLPSPSVGTADATKSTSNTRMFEIILQAHGWQDGWRLLVLKGANSRIFDRSESVRDAAITGEIGVGTTIDFYGYTAQLENPEICKYILPEDGTIVNPDPIALMTTSPKPEAAQAFIAWILSTEGQKPWLNPKINRLPMNPLVFDTPEGLERADLKDIYEKTKEALIIEFSDDLALSYEYSLMYYYSATIVRPQLKLTDVWMDLTLAKENGDITQQQFKELAEKLGDPHLMEFTDPDTMTQETFTEEYAQSINDKMMTDATFRQHLIDEWMTAAEDHYDSIQAELEDMTG